MQDIHHCKNARNITYEIVKCSSVLTLRMRRMVATPDVAITLALLGTRFSRMGMMLSAPWSNLLPSNDDKYLRGERTWCLTASVTNQVQFASLSVILITHDTAPAVFETWCVRRCAAVTGRMLLVVPGSIITRVLSP